MSKRQRNRKRNKHIIHNWWRGDVEDEKRWRFPTKEAAWAHVVGVVRRRIKQFEPEESTCNHGPTQIDMDKFKQDLFNGNCMATIVYCQCSSWFDNWTYFKED